MPHNAKDTGLRDQVSISAHNFSAKCMDFKPSNAISLHLIVFKMTESIVWQRFYLYSVSPKYLSTWLHWECSQKGESAESFLNRVLTESNGNGEGIFEWTIGQKKNHSKRVKDTSRGVGTIQKDWAIVKSFDLREAFCIAVVAHKGWNNEPQIPYSLVVSFEAINSEIEIYESFVRVQPELKVQEKVQVTIS